MGLENKICLVCDMEYRRTYHTKSRWAKSKFCSKKCGTEFLVENQKINPSNKGRVFDEITRKNMSNAHIGKKHTTEQIEKIRQGNIGKHDGNKTYNSTGKHSGELNGMYGKEPWNKGLKNWIVPWNKGIPWSNETKQQMRESWVFTRINKEIEGEISQYEGRYALIKAMDNARQRDQNICQWYNCGSQDNINVHHIFPRSEYPALELIEEYMICYCTYHHAKFHEMRGDKYYNIIKYQKGKNKEVIPEVVSFSE